MYLLLSSRCLGLLFSVYVDSWVMLSTIAVVKKLYLSPSCVGKSHVVDCTHLRIKVHIEAGYVIVVSVVFVAEPAVITSLFLLLNPS
ncbi:hypothetical protein DPMN_124708 [Dreissena polymorpha]|uniref:Uncharacterized protein n=2 Tax=Dreissena polymorpha TaxID=45954 RepID=A0A9D4GWV9_DREPO|nr:hypothetical protein DPMN_124708 [Dreissena polymorpha]